MTTQSASPADSGSQPTKIDFGPEAAAISPELVSLRRQLHRIPELGNNLPKTQAAVLQTDLPVTANDPAETAFVLDEVPGTFIFLGAHPDPLPKTPPTNHSARAVFDDAVLTEQATTLAHLAYTKITNLASTCAAPSP